MAAYSTYPDVQEREGLFVARGNIECWRGSINDLAKAAHLAADALADGGNRASLSARVRVSFSDGEQAVYESLEEFERVASTVQLSDFATIRIEVGTETEAEQPKSEIAIVARREIPGILIAVSGRNRAFVQGLADLVYQRLMVGYIDRLGSWRSLAAAATTSPAFILILFVVQIAPDMSLVAIILGVAVLALVAIGLILILFAWGVGVFQVKTPIQLVATDQLAKPSRVRSAIDWLIANKWVRRTLWVIATLILGIASSKIADILPWP